MNCPECGHENFHILPSFNGRAHTCSTDRKVQKKCKNKDTCPYCQTCLGARMERANRLYDEQVTNRKAQ